LSTARTILEVGGGTGTFWQQKPVPVSGATVVLSDISPAMLSALANIDIPGCRLEVCAADILALPFRNESFDAILAHSMLHYAIDKVGGARELLRVKSNRGWVGVLVSGSRNMEELTRLVDSPSDGVDMSSREVAAFDELQADITLREVFASVHKSTLDGRLEVTNVDAAMRYLRSLAVVRRARPSDDYFGRCASRLGDAIAKYGTFSISKRQCLYICE
jgi:hypothetical protein